MISWWQLLAGIYAFGLVASLGIVVLGLREEAVEFLKAFNMWSGD